MAQLDVCLTGDHDGPLLGRQYSVMEIDHEIFSMVIRSLPLIQEGSCQFLEKECAQYWLTA